MCGELSSLEQGLIEVRGTADGAAHGEIVAGEGGGGATKLLAQAFLFDENAELRGQAERVQRVGSLV
jgi:hypothetical protein